MKSIAAISLISVVCLWLASTGLAEEPLTRHEWSKIAYPPLPCPWASGVTVPSLDQSQGKGLCLNLSFQRVNVAVDENGSYVSADQSEFVEPDPAKIFVRMHLPNGKTAKPKREENEFLAWDGVNSLASYANIEFVFPWTENELSEAWIELRYPEYAYWLEVPYGFARNPSDRLCNSSTAGPPKFVKAMTPLEEHAKIVNWKHVVYDLGEIQNKWHLTLKHSNSFDASSEVILYRDDTQVGKSSYLWDSHSPRTSAAIRQTDEFILKSRAMSIRLHDDGLRRSDAFEFNRNPSGNDIRDWGRMTITIDDKQYQAILPSSLYRYVHGVADPYHKSTLRAEP